MRIDMKMEKMSQKALERKSNKPIMEKKRRARINHCLNQLKALILEADNERSRHSKLEKADILEMTVKYLQTFRAYHIHLQQLNQIQQQGQHQIHQQLQQQALGQQRLASGASVSSTPSPPMNLQLSQLALPLQLSLQAAVASVPLQPLSPVSPADSQKSYNHHHHHHQQHRQQHPNHHMSHLSHHLSHLNHLSQQRPVALCTAANQNQEEQMSPTWRPW